MSSTTTTLLYDAMSADPTSTITILSTLYANAQVNTFDDVLTYISTPYVLFVNVMDWSQFFSQKDYVDNNDEVIINLVVNTEYLQSSVFNTDQTSVYYRGINGSTEPNDFLGLETINVSEDGITQTGTERHFGFRLLEMSALKMFKNAKARAVIKNDTDYVNGTITNNHDESPLYQSLSSQILGAFETNKHEIFNQYINTGRYPALPDATGTIAFDFTDLNFQIKLVYDSYTTSPIDAVGNYTNQITNSVLLIFGTQYDANLFVYGPTTGVNHA
jgi:hypothetical protein